MRSTQAAVQLPGATDPLDPDGQAVRVARLLDDALNESVLVLGPFPPQGRDLDILAREPERRLIGAALRDDGFLPRNPRLAARRRWVEQWVRFSGAHAFAVDVHPPERWGLPLAELNALFGDGVGLAGFRHVKRCAPHQVLLLIARSLTGSGARLDLKRRARIDRALAEEPEAWTVARRHAVAWGLDRALHALEAEYGGAIPSPRALAASRAELLAVRARRAGLGAAVRLARQKRPRGTTIVSLSGLDGAGKSSQASALKTTLASVGVDATIEWMPLGHSPRNPAVRMIRRSATVVLTSLHSLGKRATGAGAGAASGTDPAAPPQNLTRALRERSRAGTHAWATTVALIQALQHRRAALRHSGTGRVVIFDRYTLDSSAQLRFFYGAANEFRLQKWLIRVVSPKARCAYLLDVPAETLLTRKDLQYSPTEVQQQVRLYQSEAARLGVHRLDGERPMDELSEEIARDVWKRIG